MNLDMKVREVSQSGYPPLGDGLIIEGTTRKRRRSQERLSIGITNFHGKENGHEKGIECNWIGCGKCG